MLPFYHDKEKTSEACNIDKKNYIEFTNLIYEMYISCMMKKDSPSIFIEKLEGAILKDTENRLRMFLFSFYNSITDRFEKLKEEINVNVKR